MAADHSEGLALPPDRIDRVAFLGTPEAAVPSLQALFGAGFEIALVVSQPDRRRGRGGRLVPSPVKGAAIELGLEVTDDLEALKHLGSGTPSANLPSSNARTSIDLAVVVAYGQIIPATILQRIAMVNVHFSLLPRWRGAAPVERAILAGDAETGVSIMALAEGLDTGDVYASESVAVDDSTALELTATLADLGARLLVKTLDRGLVDAHGAKRAEPQNGEPTYAAKLLRSESKLSFDDTALDVERRVRIGRSWTWFRQARLGVERARLGSESQDSMPPGTIVDLSPQAVSVATSAGVVHLLEVKPEGRRAVAVGDWINGARVEVGERLGVEPDSQP